MQRRDRTREIAGYLRVELVTDQDMENWLTFQTICKMHRKSASQAIRDYIKNEADGYREGRIV